MTVAVRVVVFVVCAALATPILIGFGAAWNKRRVAGCQYVSQMLG